jgi:hypothetical protein
MPYWSSSAGSPIPYTPITRDAALFIPLIFGLLKLLASCLGPLRRYTIPSWH